MKRALGASLAVALSGCASFQAWQPIDRDLLGVLVACQAVDYMQTENGLDTGEYEESNPIIGSHPSDATLLAFKAAVTTGMWWIADASGDTKTRTAALVIPLLFCAGTVGHNISVGVSIR